MSQNIEVTVKGFTVSESVDPVSKTDVASKFKPKAVTALKSVSVDPPKGKTLTDYSVSFTVTVKAVPKGVKAEVKVVFYNVDTYSKKDKYLGEASGSGTVGTTAPDKGDIEAAVDAALQTAIKTVIGGIKDNAHKP